MRVLVAVLLVLSASWSAAAQTRHRLYACMVTSRGYVVGAPLKLSGLTELADGAWRQLGFNHPDIQALDYDPRDPRVIYLAAGNGCIRSADRGRTWRITTSWDMTELRDVAVDPSLPDHVYLALTDGIGVTRDQGRTWSRQDKGIRRKYTQTIRVDRSRARRVFAGTELGIYVTDNGGGEWRLAGAEGAMVTDLAQSPHDPRLWLATTQEHGAFLSRDGGAAWNRIAAIGTEHTLYNSGFDPADPRRLAIAGWGPGLLISSDGGTTWTPRNQGLPSKQLWRVAFDPDHPGRIYTSVHEEPVFRSDDGGLGWQPAGLGGSVVYDFEFVPESGTAQ